MKDDKPLDSGAFSRVSRVELVTPLKSLEVKAILDALDATENNIGLSAKLLGVGRTTLYRKIKKLKNSGLLR